MKAIRVQQFGEPEVLHLEDIEAPKPQKGQVFVRLSAAGVNPVETYIRSGKYAKLPDLPYTPGSDGAGIVEAIGGNVTGIVLGDRVYVAGSLTGTYAEGCLCTASQVHPLPNTLSFSQGASIGVPYATAFHALFGRGAARTGETVLIHGGTGGVGIAAVQLAVAAGLNVFATGGTETGRVLLIEQGAQKAFDHHEVSYLEQIRAATDGRGVDLVIEMLANVNLGKVLSILAPQGRVAIVGSRGPVEINPRDLMSREADVRGVMLSAVAAPELSKIHAALGETFRKGSTAPVVGTEIPLAQAAEAHTAVMTPGAHGKVALKTI